MAFGRGFDSPRLHSPSTEKRDDTLVSSRQSGFGPEKRKAPRKCGTTSAGGAAEAKRARSLGVEGVPHLGRRWLACAVGKTTAIKSAVLENNLSSAVKLTGDKMTVFPGARFARVNADSAKLEDAVLDASRGQMLDHAQLKMTVLNLRFDEHQMKAHGVKSAVADAPCPRVHKAYLNEINTL